MAAFHYIALSADGKELSGIIEAPDELGARTKLNGLGLSIVSLEQTLEVSSAPAHPTKATFEFTAFDKNRKKVVGTIAAEDAAEAYSRLFSQYKLDVTGLALNGSQIDLQVIQDAYQKLHSLDAELLQANAAVKIDPARVELLAKVDFTTGKIQEFLKMYGPDLKQEERETIQAYLNQLIRIKDSTNLEHIRVTCEKMLDHIQKQELFLHEEQRMKESTHIKVETREMLSSLKRTGLKQEIDFISILSKIQNIPFIKPIAEALLRATNASTPEIRQVREEIKSVNRHIWEYVRIMITAKNSIIRREGWQTIQTLRSEKKRLKLKMEGLIQEERARTQVQETPSHLEEHIKHGLAFLFGAYFLLYVLTYPLTVKKLGFVLPADLYFYRTTLPKYVMIFAMLFYAAFQIRHLFLSKKPYSKAILYPSTLVIYLLILINLM